MLDPMKNKPIGVPEVQEKFGVTPDKVIDVQALAGDSTDNVPGVPGHRRQDRGRAHQHLWRPGRAAGARRRDQAAEAAREPARQCRAGAHLQEAGDAERRRAGGDAARGAGAAQARCPARCSSFVKARSSARSRLASCTASRRRRERRRADGRHRAAGRARVAGTVARRRAEGRAARAAADRAVRPADTSWCRTVEALERWVREARAQGSRRRRHRTRSRHLIAGVLCGVSLALAPGKACYMPLGHAVAAAICLGGERAEADPDARGARHPEAAAGRPVGAQDRPRHQVRHRRS